MVGLLEVGADALVVRRAGYAPQRPSCIALPRLRRLFGLSGGQKGREHLITRDSGWCDTPRGVEMRIDPRTSLQPSDSQGAQQRRGLEPWCKGAKNPTSLERGRGGVKTARRAWRGRYPQNPTRPRPLPVPAGRFPLSQGGWPAFALRLPGTRSGALRRPRAWP